MEPNPVTVVVPAAPPKQAAAPVHDEWGIYDPERAGLEAVLRRLTEKEDAVPSTGTSLAPRNACVRSR